MISDLTSLHQLDISVPDQTQLAILAKSGDQDACLQLVQANIGICRWAVGAYVGLAEYDRIKEDLLAEAVMGVTEDAIKRFDPNRGNANFTTTCRWSVRSRVWKGVRTRAAISDKPKTNYRPVSVLVSSLNEPIGGSDNEDAEYLERVQEPRQLNVEYLDAGDQLARMARCLFGQELYCFRKRFLENKSLQQIGSIMGISRERARQIQNEAVRKILLKAGVEPDVRAFLERWKTFSPAESLIEPANNDVPRDSRAFTPEARARAKATAVRLVAEKRADPAWHCGCGKLMARRTDPMCRTCLDVIGTQASEILRLLAEPAPRKRSPRR